MKFGWDAKKIAKHMAAQYLPERSYRVLGKTFLVNKKDSAFGEFNQGSNSIFAAREYSIAATRIYRDLRNHLFPGVHPLLRLRKPNVSSWIPFVAGQSSAYILNFPSIHYSVNDPLILVLRYVLYKNKVKSIDKSFTKVLLPNSSYCLSWPADEKPLEEGSAGRLIVYSYCPLFRGQEFRFFVVFKSGGLVRSGVHSWPSSDLGLFKNRSRFQDRNKTPSLSGNEEYQYCQEIFSPLPCIDQHSKDLPTNGNNGHQ
jgi:hypothetical protein